MKTNQTWLGMSLLVAWVIIIGMLSSSASVAPTEKMASASAEEYARAFLAQNSPVAYTGEFFFVRVYPDASREDVYGQFSLNEEMFVTELVINDETIVGLDDPPLLGLPANGRGSCTNYNLWLQGYDGGGEYVASGYFHRELLQPGEPIVVTLSPLSVPQFVSFSLPDGVTEDEVGLRLASNSWGWSYNSYRTGFDIWLGVEDDRSYEIFNFRTGEIYRRGELGGDNGEQSSAISFLYEGGVKKIELSEGWSSWPQQQFDTWVEREEGGIPAAVYMIDLQGRSLDLQVWGGLTAPGRLEVRQWMDVGEMPLISETEQSQFESPEWGGYLQTMFLRVPAGYGRVVITIIGQTGPEGFYFGIGAGGKG